MAQASRKKKPSESLLLKALKEHLGTDPAEVPVVEQTFELHDRPNVHLAVEEMLTEKERTAELIGVLAQEEHHTLSLARLTHPASARFFEKGPVEYVDVPLPEGRSLACVKHGLYLVKEKEGPLAFLVSLPRYAHPPTIKVEVMAPARERSEDFARLLVRLTRRGKAYRGHVLSLDRDCYNSLQIQYHTLPRLKREEVILPEALLQRIERHTLRFSHHAVRLAAAGRHLKRGILLYGPPGTGKTLTAMYLVSQMPGRTVLLLTGAGIGSIEAACKLARMMEPATVVLEDVDLIGTEREHQQVGANALLFELLNQMDGLAEDVDVLFLLTTNRPDVLEPALAARPGRVDQALEIPPPDRECRRKLFDLYGRGLKLELEDMERLLERTEGVSGAFIRELLRKAAVYAAEEGDGDLVVRDPHVEEAMTDLLVVGGPLTKSLLGVSGVLRRLAENI